MKTSNVLSNFARFDEIPPQARNKPHIKLSHKTPDPKRTYFFHVREYDDIFGCLKLNAGKTFAARIVGNEILYTCASCNHKDNFCKRIGRMVAEGRLLKGKEVFVFPSNDLKKFAASVFMMSKLELNNHENTSR